MKLTCVRTLHVCHVSSAECCIRPSVLKQHFSGLYSVPQPQKLLNTSVGRWTWLYLNKIMLTYRISIRLLQPDSCLCHDETRPTRVANFCTSALYLTAVARVSSRAGLLLGCRSQCDLDRSHLPV